ncbi:DUF4468 domain-containing protein [Mucilaginibacter lappiensis]|uniref:Uncharacterized protein n=1 Tax=Mucilaginibacter lappiensis TaxID=354630 RepID=A0A1N6S972_9SPHI|nr:DUF4468 domain-containing protein [Mucilaginibacter lappiensis]MBB6108446.1 hypothetical protein [Mucilaginibacter lappiensis]MBB6131547.1 hypothetical protein [Mucilaginibacter lappiensis]SIQ37668.1 protein of unknown function [Mucilaginibacter lappiensis]
MSKTLFLILMLLIAKTCFAQKAKDSIVYNLPVINDKLIYTDSIEVKGRDSISLDTMAKKWFNSYYVAHQADTTQGNNVKGSVVCQGILEYSLAPNLYRVPFYMVVSVQINCWNNHYSYKMCNIHFRSKSGLLNAIYHYPSDPEYLIKQYKQKRRGVLDINARHMTRARLSAMNNVVLASIASLHKAMAN